jgi:hypothetical protein
VLAYKYLILHIFLLYFLKKKCLCCLESIDSEKPSPSGVNVPRKPCNYLGRIIFIDFNGVALPLGGLKSEFFAHP